MAKIYRVRPEERQVSIYDAETGMRATPNPADTYGPDHPWVRQHPWLFMSDDEQPEPTAPVETVSLDPSMRVRRGPGRPRKNP